MELKFEEVFVEVCAPTFRGIKPSNLFRYQPDDRKKLLEKLDYWNSELELSGLRVRAIKECSRTGAFLIFVYREKWLESILYKPSVRRFLKKTGYRMEKCVDDYLNQLSDRLCLEHDFPHEIGIFLGYPLEDVVGFIKNQGKNYTLSGYWKSYGDPKKARERFDSYRECTKACREKYRQGTPIIQLVKAA